MNFHKGCYLLLTDCVVEVNPCLPDMTMISNCPVNYGDGKKENSAKAKQDDGEGFNCREGFLLVEKGQRVNVNVLDTHGGLMMNGGNMTVEKRGDVHKTIVGVTSNPTTAAYVTKQSSCVIS